MVATTLLLLLAITMILVLQPQAYEEAYYGAHLGINHTVFYRKEWGGLPPRWPGAKLRTPASSVIISHSQTRSCDDLQSCSAKMQYLQKFHQQHFKTSDVGYNFAIGGDSNVYVGRGWDVENMHRKNSIGINFIGDYQYDDVTSRMVDAAEVLILQGLSLRKIDEGYVLVGENQTNPRMFLSPGEHVYDVIKRWPHFYNKTMF